MSTATTSGDGGRGIYALCDDALMEILVLLPDKSVLCCRAVCRRWRRVTNDRSFLAGISARRPLKMITIHSRSDGTEAVTAVSLSVDDDRASPAGSRSHLFDRTQLCRDRRTPRNNRCFDVVCSLDGLLVLYQRPGLFVVCNPITRQWTNLPALPPDPCGLATIACGFYSHGSSGEYRLLCHVGYKRRSYYYVLSTGWRSTRPPRRSGSCPGRRRSCEPVSRRGRGRCWRLTGSSGRRSLFTVSRRRWPFGTCAITSWRRSGRCAAVWRCRCHDHLNLTASGFTPSAAAATPS